MLQSREVLGAAPGAFGPEYSGTHQPRFNQLAHWLAKPVTALTECLS